MRQRVPGKVLASLDERLRRGGAERGNRQGVSGHLPMGLVLGGFEFFGLGRESAFFRGGLLNTLYLLFLLLFLRTRALQSSLEP